MKRILLFTAASGLLYLSLSSNAVGPAAMGLNATGGPGSAASCIGCHGGGPSTTTATVEIRKLSTGSTGPIVTQYIPDTNYIVKVVGNHATLTHFGFQLTALNSSNTNAGTFSNLQGAIHSSTVGGKLIIEHAAQLAKTNNQYEATFNWKAPATGAGVITFYGVINAVNNNGQVGGDKPSSPFTVALAQGAPVSVSNVEKTLSIQAYPNPITTQLHLKNLEKGNYDIHAYDISGKKIYSTTNSITSTAQEISINTNDWASGIYHLQVSKGGMRQSIVVMKQ